MKKRYLVGVVAPILSKDHIRHIIRGIAAQADECGCDILILSPLANFNSNAIEQTDTEAMIYDLILSEDFDAFLYIKDDSTMGQPIINKIEHALEHCNRYVMSVDKPENPLFDCTQYDDYYDFSRVVEHLVQEHKYRRIYCLTGPESSFQARSRIRAYFDIMDKYGLHYDETYYTYGSFWVDSSKAFAKRIISGELAMPEAVVCGNDIMAMSLIKTLQGAGISVPDDIAVTGYDGFPFSANVDVPLTTYLRNHFQLGADAMRRLFRNMTGRLCKKVTRPDNELIIGCSCGCRKIPANQLRSNHAEIKPKMWQEETFGDNLMYSLYEADSINELLKKALSHTDTLYRVKKLSIYLTDSCGSEDGSDTDTLRLRGAFCDDKFSINSSNKCFDRSSVAQYNAGEAVAFISPLHLGKKWFGYITVTFDNDKCLYDEGFLNMVTALNINLSRLTMKSGSASDTSGSRGHNRTKRRNPHSAELGLLRKQLRAAPEKFPNIDSICSYINLSRSALQRNYKALFGISIYEELIRFRIEKAKKLLTETSLSVTEISLMCGYASEGYFMKQFKKQTAMTPSEFRKKT